MDRQKTTKEFQYTKNGIPFNPPLSEMFFNTDNSERSTEEIKQWWDVPFIQTEENTRWPEGIRYDVYMLDGGAWDRPTVHGDAGTLEEAEKIALSLTALSIKKENFHDPKP